MLLSALQAPNVYLKLVFFLFFTPPMMASVQQAGVLEWQVNNVQ
jgi:hypothetical protein